MVPAETTKWQPAPARLAAPTTPVDALYVIGHFGIAHVPAEGWRLRVDGRVDRPLELDLDALRALPDRTVHAVLECFGNPLRPDEPTRRAGNVVWRGAPVAAVLDLAGASDGPVLVAQGHDRGVFDDTPCTEYLKDLPLDVVRERGILAYEMNGEPLTAEHGHPVRLFVPGYFGTNNVKWLRSLTVSDRRPEHLFTTTLYQRRAPGTGALEPVRDLDVNSLVTEVRRDGPVLRVAGWAWGAEPVAGVEVGVGPAPDGVGDWVGAELSPAVGGPFGWRRFVAEPSVAGSGACVALVRARDAAGRCQPLRGARNAVVTVSVPSASSDGESCTW
ncbi:sulfite oxidase [Actinomycetospora sp. NBRC 106375]|uniref:molybdopterin-dependent oxidoreductase n=1 Tax=Actinomycetospora sp. NBRC 106375 TaxID=3032207 RepID=UPI0024A00098|nr:molybdopterin-dependent oxidoreductase [Actinomycetospora sp. NBRC 106375]GLZ48370.1 sulfite oxidase [Actinomycetospora sp. NBRC 106375]